MSASALPSTAFQRSLDFELPVGRRAPTDAEWGAAVGEIVRGANGVARGGPAVESRAKELAESCCAVVVEALWRERTGGRLTDLRPWPAHGPQLPEVLRRRCAAAGQTLSRGSTLDAGYRAGTLYTALLPPRMRAELGAYYTPPPLAQRLLDLATAAATDWSDVTVLDPACGGGAFLAVLADRILSDPRVSGRSPGDRLARIEASLSGIELDPFGAWLAESFVALRCVDELRAAGRPLRRLVTVADALEEVLADDRRFDLVIGNPPYGRTTLDDRRRGAFGRSLYGHANLYGLFLDAALRWRARDGLVAFLTPTSFLGGQYYCRLREILVSEAPPLAIDFVSDRAGVFDSVLQETCLTLFAGNATRETSVSEVSVTDGLACPTPVGAFRVPASGGAPWIIPRNADQRRTVGRAVDLPTRLETIGYRVSTGPLVWNRHKDQMRRDPEAGAYPLVWAEAVRPGGFRFAYRTRDARYVAVRADQDHLLTRDPCVLVQRTTAKEQNRRLIACVLPSPFLREHGAAVVENHVNLVRPVGTPSVSAEALAAVLNTATVDRVFRCISGTVAVSAWELHALPLPPVHVFAEVERILACGPADPVASTDTAHRIEQLIAACYTPGEDG